MADQGEINQKITMAEIAATSATGNATITIHNYYYREEAKIVPVDAEDSENLPCPYRGLLHFGPQDAEFFFGRDVFIDELYGATKTRNFIPVLGASGSGKSSVVLAGLVPRLQQEGHWQFTHFRPEKDPFHNLAQALVPLYTPGLDQTDQIAQGNKLTAYLKNGEILLADVLGKIRQNNPNYRVLLIADQFEEIYTLVDEETRRRFLDCLLDGLETQTSLALPSTVLVTTMRADFLGNALTYPRFADVLRSVDIKIRSMNQEELTEVIAAPATKLEVSFEAGLVERILRDVADQPGNLPLLEFALTELWKQRTGKQLTHEAYEAIGRVEGALAKYANEKYGNLSAGEQEQVRRIFVQLVRPGEGAEDTRRIAMKGELGAESWTLVRQLADARLVVTSRNLQDQETVEVVHEALIKNWEVLRGWMEKDRVFRAWQERLRAAKGQWESTGRDPGSLLRGAALAEAEEKLRERSEDLRDVLEFIEHSIQEKDRFGQVEAARRKREIRTAWGIAVGSLVAVLISGGLGLMAWNQKNQADLNLAESLGRYSLTLFNEHKELEAFVQAIKVGKILQSQSTSNREVLIALQTISFQGKERNRLEGANFPFLSVSFSPNGQMIATASKDNIIKIWSPQGQFIKDLVGHRGEVYSVSFAPDSQLLVSGGTEMTVKIWNYKTGTAIDLIGHRDTVSSVVFSPDGLLVASGSWDKTIKLWTKKGKLVTTLLGHNNRVLGIDFSADGKFLASVGADGKVIFWQQDQKGDWQLQQEWQSPGQDTQKVITSVKFAPNNQMLAVTGTDGWVSLWQKDSTTTSLTWSKQPNKRWQASSNWLLSIAFSPDSQVLATGNADNKVDLWNAQGELLNIFQGHNNLIRSVSFSPDGKILATGSFDSTVKIWNVESGKEVRSLTGHKDYVYSVSFSPDGKILATGGGDSVVKIWNVESGKEMHSLIISYENYVNSVSFSPDGKTLATGSDDNTVRIWNVESGREIRTFSGHQNYVNSVSFSPDGKILATGSRDKTIKIWNVESGREIRTFSGHENYVNSVSFSPDGKILATGSEDSTIKMWNVDSGEEIHTFYGHKNAISSVSFSPDRKILATGSRDNTIKVWNVESGKEIRTFYGHENAINSVSFSPDGKTLVTGSDDKTIKIWNVETGKEIHSLIGHKGAINSVNFSSDGKTLATGSADNTIKLWNISSLDLDSLMGRSCDWIRAYLENNPKVSEEDKHLCNGIGR